MEASINQRITFVLSLCFVTCLPAACQDNNIKLIESTGFVSPVDREVNQSAKYSLHALAVMELWGSIAVRSVDGFQTFDANIRRLRAGAKGSITRRFNYSFSFQLEEIRAKTPLSLRQTWNEINLWHVLGTYKLSQSGESLYLSAGYFPPALCRECITTPWGISSLDKTPYTKNLLAFSTGRGNGMVPGIALGGLKPLGNNMRISYRLSAHHPSYSLRDFNGKLLYTSRLTWSSGDNPQKKYTYRYSGKNWNKTQGLCIGLGGSFRKQTRDALPETGIKADFFSLSYGTDFCANFHGISVDGEYYLMHNVNETNTGDQGRKWHMRCAYLIKVKRHFLEPCLLTAGYAWYDASRKSQPEYEQRYVDIGVNCYLIKTKVVLAAHYISTKTISKADRYDLLYTSLLLRV